jgi:hypothetical protein
LKVTHNFVETYLDDTKKQAFYANVTTLPVVLGGLSR